MKQTKFHIRVIVATASCLFAGCGRHHKVVQKNSTDTNPAQVVVADQDTNQSADWQSQTNTDPWAVAMRKADRIYQEKLRNPNSNKEVPLPNYQAGPLNPPAIHLNFYETRDYYPSYLLCSYDIDEKNNDQSEETKWFKASLEQIRKLGPQKFPSFRWVAVIIVNRAEYKDVSTIEQAHKVGAIFKASDVFNLSRDLSQLVADATMDRHPFKLDRQQPTPGEQQRWIIVEQHAAINHPAAGTP